MLENLWKRLFFTRISYFSEKNTVIPIHQDFSKAD